MEDVARFVLDDAALAGRLKSMRHDVTAALERAFPGEALLPARDTPGDVGKRLSTAGEEARMGLPGVVRANVRRAQEGLRVLEELSKLAPTGESQTFKALRYAAYEVESELASSL